MLRRKIAKLLNDLSVPANNSEAKVVAKEFKISYSNGVWTLNDMPKRFIPSLGMSASDAFKRFIKEYKKFYRTSRAVSAFYSLSDDEIADMFDELPYYNRVFLGKETYKPTAENFLTEKIWLDNYPDKPDRDRSKKPKVFGVNSWEEYLSNLTGDQRIAMEPYSETMSFQQFKSLFDSPRC